MINTYDHPDILRQFHREVRSAVRALAFQFHQSALIKGCCNSGKTTVLRRELENFQLNYHYTKPYLNGRDEQREAQMIRDARAAGAVLVVDYEDAQRINTSVVAEVRAMIDAGGYVILVMDQVFQGEGTLISSISNHRFLQPIVNRCGITVNQDAIIRQWKTLQSA